MRKIIIFCLAFSIAIISAQPALAEAEQELYNDTVSVAAAGTATVDLPDTASRVEFIPTGGDIRYSSSGDADTSNFIIQENVYYESEGAIDVLDFYSTTADVTIYIRAYRLGS